MVSYKNITKFEYNSYSYLPTVSREGTIASSIFSSHPQATRLWSDRTVFLNGVQQQATRLALTKPFQLIQGPPGYSYNLEYYAKSIPE
jgi:hypothetical protein